MADLWGKRILLQDSRETANKAATIYTQSVKQNLHII